MSLVLLKPQVYKDTPFRDGNDISWRLFFIFKAVTITISKLTWTVLKKIKMGNKL